MTLVTAINTEDEIEDPRTVYSGGVSSGIINKLLGDQSSVVPAVSTVADDSHNPLPCPPTKNVGFHVTTFNQKIPWCSDITSDP